MRQLLSRVSEDYLLLALLLALPLLFVLSPLRLTELPGLVDWSTLAALAGLMILSRGLEDSGALLAVGRFLLRRLGNQRYLAISLVCFAAVLSMVLTNDVALFIVVPLTLGLRSSVELKLGRLIIFEALAVNAGSALSPIGNPQNLFLWQVSGVSFWEFVLAMLPLAVALMLVVLLAVALAFPSRRLRMEAVAATAIRKPLFYSSLLCYLPFLLLAEQGLAAVAAGMAALIYLVFFPRVLAGIDWLLLLVFGLMFVDLGLLAGLPVLAGIGSGAEALPGGMFTAGLLLSQLMSNVPAAIFLENFTQEWRTLAWGVSVGGFGLAIGSLANLIALRLSRVPGLYREFHFWSLPMLLLSVVLGLWLL